MPRRARVCLPQVPLHVMQRGNDRQACFLGEADFRFYLSLLGAQAPRARCRVHAYVLMPDHVHLLLTPEESQGPGALMKAVSQRYVQYFNRTHLRSGSPWAGRFRSCPIQEERHLLPCMRYIELNPLRAGAMQVPGEYRWSSYRANAEGESATLLTPHSLYLALGTSVEARCLAYRGLFQQALEPGWVDALRRATQGNFALGDTAFAAGIEAALGRRVLPGKPGRPRKTPLRPRCGSKLVSAPCPED